MSNLSFGLINGRSPFFDPVRLGWEQKCRELGVTCHYRTSRTPDQFLNITCDEDRTLDVREFITLGVDGIVMDPCQGDGLYVEEAWEAGIPVVTFDSDLPHTSRVAYTGTDQAFLGRTMARLLRQLRPSGGTFAVVAPKEGRLEAFESEITIYNGRDDRPHWHRVELTFDDRVAWEYPEQLDMYAELNPSAIVIMRQTPMRVGNWTEFVDRHRHRGITLIGVDGADFQLDYLNRRYVDGLVGQLPHEMGTVSLQAVYNYVVNGKLESHFQPTNIVAYNLIPIELPPQEVNQNLLGHFDAVGFVAFGIVAMTALLCIAWTLYYRSNNVVRAAQPFFLFMVAGGILIVSGSLIPLSFDDEGEPEELSESFGIGICMSVPWLAFTGFTITFSALIGKLWRINQIFLAETSHTRVKVSVKDVLLPFVVLLMSNIAVLASWTVVDPLKYIRLEHAGTDYWNRVISTYGACRSENAVAYLAPLAAINLSAVTIACWQAFRARSIESEFSEAKYIGFAVAALFQAFLTGIPVVAVVRDLPRQYYAVLSIMIFILCMAVLLLIFLPKFLIRRKYSGMSLTEQRRSLTMAIDRSARSRREPSYEVGDTSSLDAFRPDRSEPSHETVNSKKTELVGSARTPPPVPESEEVQ